MPRAGSNGWGGMNDAGNASFLYADPEFVADEYETIQSPTYDEESESLRTPHCSVKAERASDAFYQALDPLPTPKELPIDHNGCKDCVSSGLDPKSNKSECLGCRKVLFDGFLKDITAEQRRKGNENPEAHGLQVVESQKPAIRLFSSARVTEFLDARENLRNPRALDQPQNVSIKTDLALTAQTSSPTDLAPLTPQTLSAVYKEIYFFAQTHKWCALSQERWTRLFERITTHVLASQAGGAESAPKRVQYSSWVARQR